MTGEAEPPVLTAKEPRSIIRLFEAYDACKRLYILTVPPSLAPSPRYARRYTVPSRSRCHSCECGYIVEGLRTVCCLAAPTLSATCDGTHGLISSSLPDNHSNSFSGRSLLCLISRLAQLSRVKHHGEVCSAFAAGDVVTLSTQPVSRQLQTSFRFLPDVISAPLSVHLAVYFPFAGSDTDLSCSIETTR